MATESSSRRRGLKSLAAALLLLATPAAADTTASGLWVVSLRPIVQARMDPLIFPGRIGGHVHNILGASNFRVDLNSPEEQQNAECTTTNVQADKSSYWTPQLYFIRPDNKYEPIPSNHNRAYYKIHGTNVQPFPKGFRMISGTGVSRFTGDMRMRTIEMEPGSDPKNEGAVPMSGLPNGDSNKALHTVHLSIEFPSCGWANQSLDSDDHFSHMAWPVKQGGGQVWMDPFTAGECPPSHPVRYPHIHLQTNYDLTPEQQKNWRTGPGEVSLILANGDTVGQSFHADFHNGWDEDVLRNAIAQCGGTNGGLSVGDNLGACPAFKGHLDGDLGNNCRYQGTIPDEEIGYFEPLEQLPGCNPRWDASHGDAKPTDCPWHTSEPEFAIPTHMYQELGRENGYPVILKNKSDGTAPEPIVGVKPFTTPWGVDNYHRFAKFKNKVLTRETVAQANAPAEFASGVGTTNFALNIKDPAPFEDRGGGTTLPENLWAVLPNAPDMSKARLPKQAMGQKLPPMPEGAEAAPPAAKLPTANAATAAPANANALNVKPPNDISDAAPANDNANVQAAAPKVQADAPKVQAATPEVQTPAPKVQGDAPKVQSPPPNVQADLSNVETPAPKVQEAPPKVPAGAPNNEVPVEEAPIENPASAVDVAQTFAASPVAPTPAVRPPANPIAPVKPQVLAADPDPTVEHTMTPLVAPPAPAPTADPKGGKRCKAKRSRRSRHHRRSRRL